MSHRGIGVPLLVTIKGLQMSLSIHGGAQRQRGGRVGLVLLRELVRERPTSGVRPKLIRIDISKMRWHFYGQPGSDFEDVKREAAQPGHTKRSWRDGNEKSFHSVNHQVVNVVVKYWGFQGGSSYWWCDRHEKDIFYLVHESYNTSHPAIPYHLVKFSEKWKWK